MAGSHSISGISAALTATTRSAVTAITMPGEKGKMFTVTAVEVQVFPTLETVVNSGGLVELENDSVDWIPFMFYTQMQSAVTSGAAKLIPTRIKANKKLPSGSKVNCYFTPFDNQSQKFTVTIHYVKEDLGGAQTYASAAKGSAVTAASKASDHVTITIPAGKGGRAYQVQVQVQGTLETVVNSGGKVEIRNKSADPSYEPTEWYTAGYTCVTSGGTELEPIYTPVDLDLPGASSFLVDYTPQDDQSQYLAVTVFWTE